MLKWLATLGVLLFSVFAIWGEPVEKAPALAAKGAPQQVRPLMRTARPNPAAIQVSRAVPPVPRIGDTPRLIGEPRLISLIAPQAAPVADAPRPQAAAPPQYRVTGSRVNVRGGPSITDAVAGTVAQGDIVDMVAPPENGWAHIRNRDTGLEGYMAARFLEAL